MEERKGDWWCPTCKFTIWASKPKCLKCGHKRPKINKTYIQSKKVDCWTSESTDLKWDKYGAYNYLKGGYYGKKLDDEPDNLEYPNCGCNAKQNCPKRHHKDTCGCYTCRGKPHKW